MHVWGPGGAEGAAPLMLVSMDIKTVMFPDPDRARPCWSS